MPRVMTAPPSFPTTAPSAGCLVLGQLPFRRSVRLRPGAAAQASPRAGVQVVPGAPGRGHTQHRDEK